MLRRVTTVIEVATFIAFVASAVRWAWTQNGWFEPYTAICGVVFVGLELSRRYFARDGSGQRASHPKDTSDSIRDVAQPGVLAAAMAAKIVEEGMPSAEAIAKYLIEHVDTFDGDNVYEGLEGKVRNGIRDIVVYNEDPDTVIDNILKSFPVGKRPRKATTIRHVTIGRRAFKLRVDSFIRQLELVVSELVGFQEQALPAPSPSADRETPNEPVSS